MTRPRTPMGASSMRITVVSTTRSDQQRCCGSVVCA
jgi:hypothetical protein